MKFKPQAPSSSTDQRPPIEDYRANQNGTATPTPVREEPDPRATPTTFGNQR